MFSKKQKPKQDDLYLNDTAKHCLANIKHKVKGDFILTKENFTYAGNSDITSAKIGSGNDARNLMQYALLSNNKANVQILSAYFDLVEYKGYLKTLSLEVQGCWGDLSVNTR